MWDPFQAGFFAGDTKNRDRGNLPFLCVFFKLPKRAETCHNPDRNPCPVWDAQPGGEPHVDFRDDLRRLPAQADP